MLNPFRRSMPRKQRRVGLSLVELLVGVAVGMIVVGGAVALFVGNLGGSRQLLTETRLNQDLRAAVDLITRDLRRSGYWGNAIQGTIAVAGAATAVNPYRSASAPSSSELAYEFSRDVAENNALDDSDKFGVRLNDGVIEMQAGDGAWPALTDAKSVRITGLAITSNNTVLPLGSWCANKCLPGTPNCPSVTVRSYSIVLQGESVKDPTIKRSLRTNVRVRNDRLDGVCPV